MATAQAWSVLNTATPKGAADKTTRPVGLLWRRGGPAQRALPSTRCYLVKPPHAPRRLACLNISHCAFRLRRESWELQFVPVCHADAANEAHVAIRYHALTVALEEARFRDVDQTYQEIVAPDPPCKTRRGYMPTITIYAGTRSRHSSSPTNPQECKTTLGSPHAHHKSTSAAPRDSLRVTPIRIWCVNWLAVAGRRCKTDTCSGEQPRST